MSYANLIVPTSPQPARVNAMSSYLMTSIYPVRDGLAMMITNSFTGIRIDMWLTFERHMTLRGDMVETRLVFVDSAMHLDTALQMARRYAFIMFTVDISPDTVPF